VKSSFNHVLHSFRSTQVSHAFYMIFAWTRTRFFSKEGEERRGGI